MSSSMDKEGVKDTPSNEDPNPQVTSLRRIQTQEMRQLPKPVSGKSAASAAVPRAKPRYAQKAGNKPKVGSVRLSPELQKKVNAKTGQVGITSSGAPALPPRANPTARRMISRLLSSDTPPTQAINIVDRLKGTPYANPKVNAAQDASARKTLEFALDLAETMFRYGAGALEVETSVIAVTAALGLRHIDVDITNQSIHLNFSPPEGESYSMLRVVRSWTNNFAGLALVHQLVSDIIAGGVTRQQSVDRLREISRQPRPFPRWMVSGAAGGFAAAFVVFIGGSIIGATLAFATALLVGQIQKYAARWRIPDFFSIAASTFVVTAIAVLGHALNVPLDPALVVSGGILLLLPSSRFVSALQDAINGFPVTAAGRFFSAGLSYAAILTGIMAALVLGEMAGAPELDVVNIHKISYPIWLLAILVAVAVVLGAVTEQTSRSVAWAAGGIALLGYGILLAVQALGMGERGAPAVVATFIGFAARIVAHHMRAPQLVLAAPAIVFLLPGLMIFRSMYGLVFDFDEMATAVVSMFMAFTIMMAIAGGVVFGDTLARPFTGSAVSGERSGIRRR